MARTEKTLKEQIADLEAYTVEWRDILRNTIYGQSMTKAIADKRAKLEDALKSPETKNFKYVQGLQNAYEAMEKDLANPFKKAMKELKDKLAGNEVELVESPLLAEQIAALQSDESREA